MVRILDGPAAGAVLGLRRAPTFLRVVIDAAGKVDALDQPEDEPSAGEVVHVYRIRPGTHGEVFLCGRGRGAQSGHFARGDYEHVADVDGEALRDREAWVAWATARAA